MIHEGRATMKRFTIDDIRSWGPCYDPSRHLPEGWSGTAVDILKMDSVPLDDRIWVVLRTDLISERSIRLFAVAAARSVQHLMTDERSIRAIEVAERYANGLATDSELDEAAREARAAWAAAEWVAAARAAELASTASASAARASAAMASAARASARERSAAEWVAARAALAEAERETNARQASILIEIIEREANQ